MFVLVALAEFVVLWACHGRANAYQTAVCTVNADSWMYNSLGQSPCRIAEFLSYPCNAFTVVPLNHSQWYAGASNNNCECNTVMYNLLAACSICQEGSQQGWNLYSQNCTHKFIGGYPEDILSVTAVPHWAYIDITGTNLLDANQAKSVGDRPETTKALGTIVTTTATVSATTTPTGASSSSSSKSKSVVGPIVGGVIGGLALIALVAGGIFYWINRHREPLVQMQSRPNIMGTPSLSPISHGMLSGGSFSETLSPNRHYEAYEPQDQSRTVSMFVTPASHV